MPRRGHRKTIAPNIYEDGSGFAVIVKVAGIPEEHRFARCTPLDQLEAVRDKLKGKARSHERPRAGSLAADAQEYLATIGDKAKRQSASNLCRHWTATYGRESRFALTKLKIEQQLAAWEHADVAASSCNKRLSALRSIFRAVNVDGDPNPTAAVRKRKEPEPEPRALDYRLIDRILAKMPDRGRPTGKGKGTRPTVSLAKLRCALMAYTGLPPAQIAKIKPDTDIKHVLVLDPSTGRKVKAPMLRARPRRKGKGTKESWLPLLPQGLAVIEALAAAGGLRKYSNSSVRDSWHRACVKVIGEQLRDGETALPHRCQARGDAIVIIPLVRPYDLRHSFLTQALRSSGNLRGVQNLGQHADSRQTLRYIEAGVPEAASTTAAAMLAHLPTEPLPRYVAAKVDGTV
ncbi:MAG: hypothetical protein Q8T13_13745 [Acidobacteriota bacterium]|nr:hypothetical protein [Acidobacteriota bacterium]